MVSSNLVTYQCVQFLRFYSKASEHRTPKYEYKCPLQTANSRMLALQNAPVNLHRSDADWAGHSPSVRPWRGSVARRP